MTEGEWLTSSDPAAMLDYVTSDVAGMNTEAEWVREPSKISDRKLRLFAVACCRRQWRECTRAVREAVDAIEEFADDESDRIGPCGLNVRYEAERLRPDPVKYRLARMADYACCRNLKPTSVFGADPVQAIASLAVPAEAPLLREIVGNPFFKPTLRKPLPFALVNMAKAIYDDSDWGATPMLADLAEDILPPDQKYLFDHLRSVGPHIRGCWALDLLIGKE